METVKPKRERFGYCTQWKRENREHWNEYAKQYRITHITTCPCGGSYQSGARTHHERTIKHKNYLASLENSN
jgi:hypothetical protein